MKELNSLLEYINEYIYDYDEEEIFIKHSSHADKAEDCYEKAVSAVRQHISDEDISEYLEEKWCLDIARDCVRGMSEDDRNYIRDNMDASKYHMGYGMYIRNQYIHSAKQHEYFDADGFSGHVMNMIFTILNPLYDYRNNNCTGYYGSGRFQTLKEFYKDKEPEIFSYIESELLKKGSSLSADRALDMLQKKLLDKLGRDEFIRVFKEFIKEYFDPGWDDDSDNWHWEWQLGKKAVLFSIEVNQVRCLHELRLFRNIDWGFITSQDDCKKFIDEKLGLKEEYAQFMARCAWESCNPFFTGRWRNLSVHHLGLPNVLTRKLCDNGLNALGDLFDKSAGEIRSIAGLNESSIRKIRKGFKIHNIKWT